MCILPDLKSVTFCHLGFKKNFGSQQSKILAHNKYSVIAILVAIQDCIIQTQAPIKVQRVYHSNALELIRSVPYSWARKD